MESKETQKKHPFDEKYMAMAEIWATNSHAKRAKVGALIVKDRMIISDGYNGTPSGFENECEEDFYEETPWGSCYRGTKTKPEVLHAEANAITKVAKSNNSSEGSTLYVTMAPCMECSKLIIQAGIVRVVYKHDYRDNAGLKLLTKANIQITKII